MEVFQFLITAFVILLPIYVFNLLFSFIVQFSLRKHLPEKWTTLRKCLPKPLKIIKLTLIRFGNEKSSCGDGCSNSIPIKLYVYNDFLVLTGYGKALIINNFEQKFISFIKTERYDEFLGKKIVNRREDLIIFSPICLLQFLINKKDREYLKNYIKEMQNG